MNGSYAINEQLSGKFHVTNIDKLPMNNPSEDILSQTTSIPDETGCASRFQMIRVDRNFGRGRWKVNDYEPPENTSISTNPLVNTIENDSNHSIFSNVQSTPNPVTTIINGDSNVTTSTAAAAPVAVATATAFQQQQQQQQRMAINNTPTVIPPPTGLIHGYPPGPLPNQSYILSNHHPQFGYYPFYPPPYSHYPSPWAPTATLPPPNPYLQPPTLAQLQQQQQQTTSQLSSTTNLNDPLRLSDTDNNNENTFSNPTIDPLQNAQLAAYLFSLQHSHPSYIPQTSSTASSYATIPSFHSVLRPYPTILPPQTLPLSKTIPNNTTDIQQSHQTSVITSPTHDEPKILLQQSSLITPKTKPLVPTILNGINNDSTKTTHIDDLMSSSPALINIQPVPPSLISPINISTTNPSTTSLNDYWTYTTTSSPLNLTQTPAVRAGTTMVLLNNETSQKTEITEILKELTTPTKQNNIADIDNKISAAMDLVKMHLLSAVREEVTELRQKIRILNEKMNNLEQENAFLRQHVSNEIYTQYISTINTVLSSSNDSTDSTTNPINSISSISSSQPTAMTPLLIIPSTLSQQTTTTLSTNQSQPS